MTGDDDELRAYYEQEAILRYRVGQPLRAGRVEVRDDFLHLLSREGRRSVIDFGSGPGRDAGAFREAGHEVVGVDLALGNARLAAEAGLRVVPASITAVPLRSSSIDAGWSLSTLMHLDADDARRAVEEMMRVLVPGAPLLVALWGREEETSVVRTGEIPDRRRPFHLRGLGDNTRLVAAGGTVERSERWEDAADGWDYHVIQVRAPA